jgi:hypothetical protein
MAAVLNFDRSEPQRLHRIDIEYAVDRVLCDADGFAEWLSAECFGKSNVTCAHEVRHGLANADAAVLLSAALKAADSNDAGTCIEAMRLLKSRFIQDQDERVKRIAAEVSFA